MTRVAVAGVRGRMGALGRAAIERTEDLVYAGGLVRADASGERVYASLDALIDAESPDVLLDFTVHPATTRLASRAVERGVRPVIGATGWTDAERAALAAQLEARGLGGMLVPNFAVGAVLMMRFAERAARFFPTAEIVELHHDAKRDAPSGTARLTAERMTARTGRDVPMHSVRLRGLTAHQEVLLGGTGELLTIRHDAFSRDAFAAGIVAAVRAVGNLHGLTIGLDAILDLD